MEETKVIYHIDDEDTPYLIKLPIAADKVTLGDLKTALNKPTFKYFFKSMDDDFGVVKEEIIDDAAHLPVFNGRVVSWLVGGDSSETQSQCADSQSGDMPQTQGERVGGIGDSRPPSFHANASSRGGDNDCDTCTETESMISSRRDHHPPHRHRDHPQHRQSNQRDHHRPSHHDNHHQPPPRINGHSKHGRTHGFDATSSVMSSDIDTTSFFDSDEDSRFSTATETTTRSSKYGRHRRRRRRHRMPPLARVGELDRASSFSSITDSTMSLNIITVTLNLDTVNFLGISIVGQSNKGGDGGIYVGSIMKGGAVAQDGRIEPGDMILEVNGVSFENMSNDDAVRTLRESVQKPGHPSSPITLVVAKCWDPNPKGYFTIPRQEPVRPIDPSAWIAHTEAVRGYPPGGGGGPPRGPLSGSMSTMTSTTSSLTSSMPDTDRWGGPAGHMMGGCGLDMNLTVNSDMNHCIRVMSQPDSGLEIRDRQWLKITIPNAFIGTFDDLNLTINTDMQTIVKAMAQPDSGMEIRDRMWLKIVIPNAFIGSDLVDWLHTHVEGFADRRDARKYATNLLKAGYIRHTVNKLSFSEQCYYVFGDLCGVTPIDYNSDLMSSGSSIGSNLVPNIAHNMSSLTLEDIDSVSEAGGHGHERNDLLAPLPGPPAWASHFTANPYGPSYLPPPPPPPPQNYAVVPPHHMGGAMGAAPPYNFMNDTASYVSMPGNGADSMHSGSAKRDRTCACIVTHTYKQIRKLWENPDKQGQAAAAAMMMHQHNHHKFDDDIDRSTSSSTVLRGRNNNKHLSAVGSSSSCVAGKDLRVGQEVCLDLCLPFWKGCNPLSASAAHKAITKMTSPPPGELNNNDFIHGRYKMASESTHVPAFIDSFNSKKGSSASTNSQRGIKNGGKISPPGGGGGEQRRSGSDTETGSIGGGAPPGIQERSLPPPPPRDLAQTNPELNASRQSFRMAMDGDETLTMMGDL